MKIKRITKDITHLIFPDRESMNRAFVRLTAYSECPNFRGQIFTLGQYRKWYASQYGAWSYFTDWRGQNIPSHCFIPFLNGDFDPLSPDEQELIDLFRGKEMPFYIIATFDDENDTTFPHEMAHALYGTNQKYKGAVDKLIKEYWAQLKDVRAHLLKIGYHESVFIDESHAYSGVDAAYLDAKGIKYPKDLAKKLVSLYNQYNTNDAES